MKHSNTSTKGTPGQSSEPLFGTGAVVMTPGVMGLIDAEKLRFGEVITFLLRHLEGDWGELDDHDRRRNEEAIEEGSRLLSAYRSSAGDKLWVITEAVNGWGARAGTTVLLPSEY